MEAACDIFYSIYDSSGQSGIISNLVQWLDFHALSIVLLATTAFNNMWDYNRLAQEWDTHHTQILQTDHNESLAATIELSLASPMFHKLGPDAHDLLSVIAFFPQGINESNHDWLFPTIPSRRNIIDKFCVLSLTHRSNGFITMLAPLRDYLHPKDPTSSPLLHAIKECYLRRLSAHADPSSPSNDKAQWIISEDVNIEHLLDVFTSIDPNSVNTWDACTHFMEHLYWYKPRLVVLGPKFEGLPDNHPSKPACLLYLSQLLSLVGDHAGCKRLLVHTLQLQRALGDDIIVAQILEILAFVNTQLLLHKEGILQVKESLGIFRQLNCVSDQACCLQELAWLLHGDNQLDAAEEAASQSLNLLPDGNKSDICQSYLVLGDICHSKGNAEKAISHYEAALRIADSSHWHTQQHSALFSLASLFLNQGRFDDAHAHIQRAKIYTVNNAYDLGCMMELHAHIWYRQGGLEEAKSEALGAVDLFEKLGAWGVERLESCRELLQWIDEGARKPVTSGELGTVQLPMPIDSPSSVWGTKQQHQ
jgi:tetratricopeptide (TPR) repeat protein